jgi:hypothetical protein
MTCEVYTKNSG